MFKRMTIILTWMKNLLGFRVRCTEAAVKFELGCVIQEGAPDRKKNILKRITNKNIIKMLEKVN